MRESLFPSGALAGALLLAGCALPAGPESSQSVLGPDAFATRIDQLEQTLIDRHDLQHQRSDETLDQMLQLNAGLQEIGALVQRLHRDVERLEQAEPEPEVEHLWDGLSLANKMVVGRSEWIGLPDVGTYLKARIDSGANTSSLSAREITRFERDGENWVRFKLGLTEDDVAVDDVRDAWIERPVERRVRILQAAGRESRPVVSLMVTLGPIREVVQFTLNDRSHLNYPVLLGRRFLMDIAVIDVAELYLHERPAFPGGRPPEEAGLDEAEDRDDDED